MGTVAAPSEFASLTDDSRTMSISSSDAQPREPPQPQPSPETEEKADPQYHFVLRVTASEPAASELKAVITLWPLFGSEASR